VLTLSRERPVPWGLAPRERGDAENDPPRGAPGATEGASWDFPNAREPLSRAPVSDAGIDLPVTPDVEFLQVDSPEMNRAMEAG